MAQTWHTTRFQLQLDRPLVMGIVNVTPDSFSDGGQHAGVAQAVAHARRLVDEGADILDIGGESSRPGAPVLAPDDEWARIEGVLQELVRWRVPISVDTCKPEVMRRALDLGWTSSTTSTRSTVLGRWRWWLNTANAACA